MNTNSYLPTYLTLNFYDTLSRLSFEKRHSFLKVNLKTFSAIKADIKTKSIIYHFFGFNAFTEDII